MDSSRAIEEQRILQHELIDNHEMYLRRCCILIHGVPESAGQTEVECMLVIVPIFQRVMELAILPDFVKATYRLGQVRESVVCRPIVVEFHSYVHKNVVFCKRSILKHKNETIKITEYLTRSRMAIMKRARHNFKHVWTKDGKIVIKVNNGVTCHSIKIASGRELDAFIAGLGRYPFIRHHQQLNTYIYTRRVVQ